VNPKLMKKPGGFSGRNRRDPRYIITPDSAAISNYIWDADMERDQEILNADSLQKREWSRSRVTWPLCLIATWKLRGPLTRLKWWRARRKSGMSKYVAILSTQFRHLR